MTAPVPVKDPFGGLRGLMAAVLILEVIVVALAIPIVIQFDLMSWASGAYLVGLIALMILGAGIQRRSWAMAYNLGLQVLFVAGVWIHVSIGIMGAIFGVVWIYIVIVRRDVTRRWDRGELPAQQQK